MRRLLALPLLLALAACGDDAAVTPRAGGSTPPPATTPSPHSYAADAVVLRVSTTGGLPRPGDVPAPPYFTLYGDGRIVTVGPQITIYPGPAYPNLQVSRVSPATVDWLAAEARKGGVDGQERDYGSSNVKDQTFTAFRLDDAKGDVELRVYALFDTSAPYTAEQEANRRRLTAFWGLLTDHPKWPEQPSAGAEYEATAVAVYARPYAGDPQAGEPMEIAWRGPDPAVGKEHRAGLCTVLTGDTLKPVIGSLRRSNTLTRFTYDGKAYLLGIRPLLPDETGCPSQASGAA